MGLVALTLGCTALGAYIARNMTGSTGLLFFIGAFACIIGLNMATSRGREQLAIALLFGLGLTLGLAVGPVLNYYAKADPGVLYQAAGATAGFVAACGAYGYATRRDLSSWARTLFWALLALIVFGIIGLFVSIPNGNLIYSIAWPRDLRRVHDLRLQPAAPREHGERGPDRRGDLPRRVQHLPVLPPHLWRRRPELVQH